MSTRIADRFQSLCASGRRGLIPYIAAGDPHPDATVGLLHALVRGGADLVELGIPFSDPMADGPVIQRAAQRAIEQGTSLVGTLEMVRNFRLDDRTTPLILMGYANPIERMGVDNFAREAARSGVDGVLVVDYPPEECAEFVQLLTGYGMNTIFLVAPTTRPERIDLLASIASGYVYYVSLKGTTGAAHIDLDDIAARLPLIRQRLTLPIGVGFGISDPESAAAVARLADAVVIGSRIITELEAHPGPRGAEAVEKLLRRFRTAIDAAQEQETP
jgi:tryptophan synthase alpha chain